VVVVLAALVVALVAVACVPPPPPPPPPLTPHTAGVTHAVRTHQFAFTDTTRPTPAFDGFPGSSSRQLPTTVWYPSDGGGPFPLVLFVHGFGVTPADYAPLLTRLASAGYVVAAATYPLLSGQPAGPTDTVGWDDLYPDSWFVASQVLERSAAGDAVLGGLIDPDRIAVAGHSDGAAVAFGLGYTPFRLDVRARAVVAYAADIGQYPTYQPNQRPILHVLSDHDDFNPYGDAIAWDRSILQPPKTVLSLWDASHSGPYLESGDAHFEMVARVTIGWLDAALKAHPEGLLFASFYVGDHPALGAIEME
jgi:dienelactone hydrolase